MNISGDTTHHVVTGRHDRYRSGHRIDMRKGLRQFTDARQAAVQHFFTEVIQLQHHVVAIRATAIASQDFLDHRARNDVTTSQVFRIRSIALHETLAVLVDQVATFTTATFGYQHTRAGDTGRVELPHLDVLNRHACAQRHAHAVAGVDQSIGGRCIDATSTTSRKNSGLRTNVNGFTGFDADGDNTNDRTILVLNQIDRIPLI